MKDDITVPPWLWFPPFAVTRHAAICAELLQETQENTKKGLLPLNIYDKMTEEVKEDCCSQAVFRETRYCERKEQKHKIYTGTRR